MCSLLAVLRSFRVHPEARWPNLKTVLLGDDQEDNALKHDLVILLFKILILLLEKENITGTPQVSLFRNIVS